QCLSVLEALGKDGFRKEALSYQLARSSGFSWDRCYGETKSVYRHALATH
ncbi:glycosyltransferase family 1 protein, partial [Escherichia coli]|nr:glycosyltransferase family 1 protein [Escherichia coli]